MSNLKYKKYDHILQMEPNELLKLQRKKGWILSSIGNMVYGILCLLGCQQKMFYDICPYFEIGQNWGGLSLGWFFICCKGSSESLKCHEVGHLIQAASNNGFIMFILCVCSVIRYWYREIFGAKTPYDAWWFEGQATELGTKYVQIRKNELQKENTK